MSPKSFRFKDFFGGLLFFAAGLFFFVGPWFEKPARDYLDWIRWTPTPCRIVRTETRETAVDGIDRSVVVRYGYTFAGKERTGVRESPPNPRRMATDAEIHALSASFPAGSETVCRVNPDAPDASLLRADFPWKYIGFSSFASIFVLIGGALALSSFGIVREPRDWFRGAVAGRRIGMLAGLLFMGVGLTALIARWVPVLARPDVSGWTPIPCVVEAAAIRTVHGSKGAVSHYFEARYAYETAGKIFRSHNVLADGSAFPVRNSHDAMLAHYATGTRTTCLTNPADPAQSALVAYPDDAGERIGFSVFLGGFALIGAFLFAACLADGKVRNSERLQKAGITFFVAVFCAMFVAGGLCAPDIRINGVRTGSPWVRGLFVAFGVGVALVVLVKNWRRIDEAAAEKKPAAKPRRGSK